MKPGWPFVCFPNPLALRGVNYSYSTLAYVLHFLAQHVLKV